MDEKSNNKLSVFFWNAGITPFQYSEASAEGVDLAVKIIDKMKSNNSSYIIILCEVNDSAIKEIKKTTIKNITNLTSKITKSSSFDMCIISSDDVIIDSDSISYIKGSNLTSMQEHFDKNQNNTANSGRSTKVGVHFKVKKEGEESIDIIASHWSSRLYGYSSINRKESIDKIKPIIKKAIGRSETGVIVMGDFNETPEFLNDRLMGYNNKYYAMQDKSRLYNLSSSFSKPHFPYKKKETRHFNGTYLSRDKSTRKNHPESCSTIDQALVSSYFIRDNKWSLSELSSGIFVDEDIISMLYTGEIDHLPLVVEVEKLL